MLTETWRGKIFSCNRCHKTKRSHIFEVCGSTTSYSWPQLYADVISNQINHFLHRSSSVTRDTRKVISSPILPKWSPPFDDFINYDASYCSIIKNGGYGLIVTNFAGTHLASRCNSFGNAPGSGSRDCVAVLEVVK